MSHFEKLVLGDVVMVATPQFAGEQTGSLGIIKYIGALHGGKSSKNYIGLELVEPVPGGHNGTVQGIFYYHAHPMHGIFVEPSQVIKKLTAAEVMMKYLNSMMNLRTQALKNAEVIDEKQKKIEVLTLYNSTLRNQVTQYYNIHKRCCSDDIRPVPSSMKETTGARREPKELKIKTIFEDDIAPLSPFPTSAYHTPVEITPFERGAGEKASFDLPSMITPSGSRQMGKQPQILIPSFSPDKATEDALYEMPGSNFPSVENGDYPKIGETPPLSDLAAMTFVEQH